MILRFIAFIGLTLFSILQLMAQETRLLRQPSLGVRTIAFTYGSDIWLSDLNGDKVTRITATPAVESNPVISPDGSLVAFTSNREGNSAVYVVSIGGGTPKRLTWHPAGATVVAWSPDGTEIIYASGRDYAPKPSQRLWKISKDGGNAQLVTSLRGVSASYSPDGSSIVVDVVSRWESEFRGYRGGQNTPLVVLNLQNESEVFIPNEHTIDIQPVWLDDKIYFLSDRQGGVANIWSFQVGDGALHQLTTFDGADVKWLAGRGEQLIFEREGRLHLFHLPSEKVTTLNIHVSGDFPWSEEQWEDVTDDVQFVSLSAKGKRVLMEARGDIFTIPTEYGDIRNITMSPLAADRKPIWSPSGDQIAWFSDEGHANYRLKRSTQDGIKTMADISLGESKYIWEPQWSPDEKYIAFVDDDLRIRLVDMEKGSIRTIGLGGLNIERGSMGLSWSPDSRWLAYSKSGSNNFQQIMVWSADSDSTVALTNEFANAFSATWDLDGKHLYFLGSTDVALGSGWTNTSAMNAEPEYAAYVVNLNASDPSPFELRSDEEKVSDETDKKEADDTEKKKESAGKKEEKLRVEINFVNIDRRIIPLPIPARDYAFVVSGPSGAVFIGERIPNERGMTIHKFTLKERESKEFADKVSRMEVSSDHEKILIQTQGKWNLSDTKGEKATLKPIAVKLDLKLNRSAEWKQMFEEAWRYEKDFFYDPGLHGRNWDEVYQRYAPLIPFVQHRADLNYIFDQMNGELSVGHSFVFGGDFPKVGESKVGLLGADLESASGGWMIKRIYTTENWNPELTSPLDQPGLKVQEGNFIVGVNGRPLSGTENLYERLDGTLDKQTTLHINEKPSFEGSWTIIVKPIGSEVNLR
ncbi:MAG: PD40 domain-containing protein, partial [Saprospiraceae bacterium]|nr:PD40 domain-containing protein [Saprospiraceae bacterium]